METDYTEALTPICISLTNLAENQIHGSTGGEEQVKRLLVTLVTES